MYRVFIFCFFLPQIALAQSALQPCQGDRSGWHHCFLMSVRPDGVGYVEEEYRHGQPTGQGTIIYRLGHRYHGGIRQGKPNGQGTHIFPDGSTHVGEFRNGIRHGMGAYSYADGRKFSGEYRDGSPSGLAILYRADGTIESSGRWENGQLVQQFALDTKRFPFDSQPSVASLASASNFELDAERKRRQQLEADLEAEKKRRIAAETRGRAASQSNSSGTGFAVAPGLLITNQHIVAGCQKLEVLSRDGRRAARVLDADELVDLALLRVTGLGGSTAAIRRSGSVRLGEAAYAFGFPLTGLLSEAGNFTSGVVSSLRGMRDSANHIQISTPVQPGNSGGALVDASGNVIGVVVGKLNASAVARATGDIPQNVNFAVSVQALLDFLTRNKVTVKAVERGPVIDTAILAEAMGGFTHRIECLDAPSVAEQRAPQGHAPAQGGAHTAVRLANRAPLNIIRIFVTVQGGGWGDNLLGSSILRAGGSFPLDRRSVGKCIHDVLVQYADGVIEKKLSQDLCALMEIVFTGGS